jgi:hypothetical protein
MLARARNPKKNASARALGRAGFHTVFSHNRVGDSSWVRDVDVRDLRKWRPIDRILA